jgi:hypothetical protein
LKIMHHTPYELMVALSCTRRVCPYPMLQPYVGVKIEIRLSDDQPIQSAIRRMAM